VVEVGAAMKLFYWEVDVAMIAATAIAITIEVEAEVEATRTVAATTVTSTVTMSMYINKETARLLFWAHKQCDSNQSRLYL
jgi:hypothetical protein